MSSRKRQLVAAVNQFTEVASNKKKSRAANSKAKQTKIVKTKATQQKESSACGSPRKLPRSFYEQNCDDLAMSLLGKKLVRKMNNDEILEGYIVETEAYLGEEDKAAHSYEGKRTARNAAMFMEPGTVYVYHIYGMYTCINISSRGEGCAVLIRALDPCASSEESMTTHRSKGRKPTSKKLKVKDLGSGPSKLTQALCIGKAGFDQTHICDNESIWLEEGIDVDDKDIVKSARIGINYAGDWVKKLLRYYVLGNVSVSVRDKNKEEEMKKDSLK